MVVEWAEGMVMGDQPQLGAGVTNVYIDLLRWS